MQIFFLFLGKTLHMFLFKVWKKDLENVISGEELLQPLEKNIDRNEEN